MFSTTRMAAAGARALPAIAVLAWLPAGCSVNMGGLGLDAAVDRPADQALESDAPTVDGDGDGGQDQTGDGAGGCATCDDGATFIVLPGRRLTGTTAGRPAQHQGSCGGHDAPEAVFKIALFETSDLFITTHGTGFDTVVYLRRDLCCGEELACNDDADERSTSVIAQTGVAPGTYYIFVDGKTAADAGSFTIDVYATPTAAEAAEACGNPKRITNMPLAGNTCKSVDDYTPPTGCSSAVSGPNGLDQVFYFVLDTPGEVSFSTCDATCIDTVLYLREVCSDATTVPLHGCDDDSCRASGSCQLAGNLVQSKVTATLGAGVHYLVLDSFAAASPAPCGKFTITPTGVP